MKRSVKVGFSFGLTSGVITTLGLMIGLYAAQPTKLVIISGIAVIAVADSLSDAFGIHMSEESQRRSDKAVWEATWTTFLFKFIFALSFIIPVLALPLMEAMVVSVLWGGIAIAGWTYYFCKSCRKKPGVMIGKHLFIGLIVIVASHYVGKLVQVFFG